MIARWLAWLLVAAGLAGAHTAAAATITMETRQGTRTSFATAQEYLDNWNSLAIGTPGSGYGTANITTWDLSNTPEVNNHSLVAGGENDNVAYHFQVVFGVTASATWEFRIGADFAYGGALFLDGVAVAVNSGDLWWDLSFGDPTQLLAFSALLGPGNHTLDVYGQEDCCDGASAGQYRIGRLGEFQPFGPANPPIVPVPAALPLFMTGLGLIGWLGWRRQR